MTPEAAWIDGTAACYGCGEPLARRSVVRPMIGDYIATTIVQRDTNHTATGLPRYGPSHRSGHADARHSRVRRGWSGPKAPGRFYVNCPACDRGQVVTFA